MIKALRLNAADNVATLLEDAGKGETVLVISEQNESLGKLELIQAIPFGNKVALRPMKPEDHLIKGASQSAKQSNLFLRVSLLTFKTFEA